MQIAQVCAVLILVSFYCKFIHIRATVRVSTGYVIMYNHSMISVSVHHEAGPIIHISTCNMTRQYDCYSIKIIVNNIIRVYYNKAPIIIQAQSYRAALKQLPLAQQIFQLAYM